MSDLIDNPFLNKSQLIHRDESKDEDIMLTQLNISKYYRVAYILVKRNNDTIPSEFYNWQIPKDIFEKVSTNLIIQKVSIKILKNKNHFDNLIFLSNDTLQEYNIFNYELAEKNIVIPIFSIEYRNLLKYIEQYESTDNLESLFKLLVLNNYFEVKQTVSNDMICKTINNLEESNFYTKNYNCIVNITDKFKGRQFSSQTNYIANRTIAKTITQIFNNTTHNATTQNASKSTFHDDSNYIEEMSFTNKNYVDISSNMKKLGFTIYRLTSKSIFTNSDINILFDNLNEEQQFKVYSHMMVSPSDCHLVVCNSMILGRMKQIEIRFAPYFRYLKSYAINELYKKECIKKANLKTTDECIFDSTTASLQICYPFMHDKPKENPYMPILVADSELNPQNNLCGIPEYNNMISHGISNLKEFKTRMNIFSTGNSMYDLFQDFDFVKNDMAVTGGIMSACLQKQHPLLSRFIGVPANPELDFNKKFKAYIDEFYYDSDIDIMVKTKDVYTFIDKVTLLHNQVVVNTCTFFPTADPNYIRLELNKLGYLFVTEDFIKKNITTYELEYIEENINTDEIKELFKPHYLKLMDQHIEKLNSTDISKKANYPDVFNFENIDFKIYINRNKKEDTFETFDIINYENKDANLIYTYKYKITSKYVNHNLEIFPVKHDDFFAIVSSFHLPCVRGYYNGSNFYITTSCLCDHMT